MKEVTSENFGLVIAYVLPGFVTLWGVRFFSATVESWFAVAPNVAPTVGGFLYVTIGSLAAGLIVSTVRWTVVDTIHHRSGVAQPRWNFGGLEGSLSAFELVIAHHYRHYQFHANTFVAVAFAFAAYALASGEQGTSLVWALLSVVFVETVLWIGSRDTLRKCYARGSALLGEVPPNKQSGGEARHPADRPLKLDGPYG